ncbi:hypothetical protein IW261DRAFT_1498244 [Armillaria novae-zelandiae]|uniref:Uncharacterized protein n=1 Tax=Armillaria novae-zelandiae TaxID=153914 RepID=A0AA39UDD7_9AGAR|nr:hypothetical protein IW261DRAFT_1498244 [Armillaria novae-zelandiae]
MTSTVDAGGLSRAAQRKQRLLEIENEQRLEDVEALKMTEEQRQVLLRSFASVTFEFFPLDGLEWTPVSLHKRIQVRLFRYLKCNLIAERRIGDEPSGDKGNSNDDNRLG